MFEQKKGIKYLLVSFLAGVSTCLFQVIDTCVNSIRGSYIYFKRSGILNEMKIENYFYWNFQSQ
jgi:hypothetical protein